MQQVWLIELLKGIGRCFLNPVFYYLFFLAGILGVNRVRRERKNFHIRALDAYFELRQLLPIGIGAGAVLSVISVAAGIAVPFAAILFIAAFTFLLSFTTKIRLLSPAYTAGAAFFAVIIFAEKKWSLPFFSTAFHSIHDKVYPSIVVVLSLLLIAEGFLLLKNGGKGTSPKLVKSKRGQTVGMHEVKRLWLLPMFLLIPGDALHLSFSWWPIFHLGAKSYSLILVPFSIGYHQQIQGMLPKDSIQAVGRRVVLLGIVIAILSLAGLWYPIVSIPAAAIAIIGRELIAFLQRSSDDSLPFYFSRKNNGLMILGIIPDSPASKMGLKVGELIARVNGVSVRDEQSLYMALQRNRAHCKLDVLDSRGEIRFVQCALFEGDHHELGVLIVQEERRFQDEGIM